MSTDPKPKRKRGRPCKPLITLDYFLIGDLAAADWAFKDIAEKCGMTEQEFCRRLEWDTSLQVALDKSDEPIDYNYVNVLASWHCSDAMIARKIKMSPSQFSKRLKADIALQDAVTGGRNDFVTTLCKSKRQSIETQYVSTCRECGYIMEGRELYRDMDPEGKPINRLRMPLVCIKCSSEKLEYERKPPSADMLKWESKQHLGESERMELTGDRNKPLVVEEIVDEAELDAQITRFIARREAKIKEGSEKGEQAIS